MKPLLLLAAAFLAANAAAQTPLLVELHPLGHRVNPSTEEAVELFSLAVGDTKAEDAKLERRDDKLLPFKLDSAQYGPKEDGTWRLAQFRMPDLSARPGNDSQAFLDYLKRREVRDFLNGDWYSREDFGKPGDYIYKKETVSRADLPDPFNRLSPETLSVIKAVFRYNADGSMNVLLKQPYDEDGKAQRVLARIKAELGLP